MSIKSSYFLGDASASDAPWTDVVREDFHVAVFKDKYPVTEGHLLFVPKYNTKPVITNAFSDALSEGQRMVESGECDGFNIGINIGSSE